MQARKPHEFSEPETSSDLADSIELHPVLFRRRLMNWYRMHARELPWRGVSDPYRTWVSEVMLQQTRVAAVIEHYNDFLRRFPTIELVDREPEYKRGLSVRGPKRLKIAIRPA